MQFCRLCAELCPNGINLFQQNEKELLQQIKNLTGLSLQDTPDMPQHICENCQVNLEKAHEFREQCINSQNYFNTKECKTKIRIEKLEIETTSIYKRSNDADSMQTDSQPEASTTSAIKAEISITSKLSLIKEKLKENLTMEQNLTMQVKQEQIDENSVNWDNIEFMKLSNASETEANVQQILDNSEAPFIKTNSGESNQRELTELQSSWDCEDCGLRCKTKSILAKHKKRHGEKQFKCHLCLKKFFVKFELKRHFLTHTKKYPEITNCGECGKQLTTRKSLLEHIKRHSGEKPFSCEICLKRFFSKVEMERHMIAHSMSELVSWRKNGNISAN